MSLNKFIEEQIQKGISEGLFDNLKGAGKPLDLNEYFNAPEDVRMGYSLLKSNDILPPEVELLREIAELRKQFTEESDAARKKVISRRISDREMEFNIMRERLKRRK